MIVTPKLLGRDKLSNSNINNPTFIDSLPLISWCRISILRPKFLLVLSVSWESSGCPIYSKNKHAFYLCLHTANHQNSCVEHTYVQGQIHSSFPISVYHWYSQPETQVRGVTCSLQSWQWYPGRHRTFHTAVVLLKLPVLKKEFSPLIWHKTNTFVKYK